LNQPAKRQGLATFGTNFDRDLVVRAAYAAGFDFQHGHDVVYRFVENFHRIQTAFVFDDVKSAIRDPLGKSLLTVKHDVVDEFGNPHITVQRIRKDLSFWDMAFTWQLSSLLK
jgi:hypothetical protein